MLKNQNFYLRVASTLIDCKGAIEYSLFKLATGERPKKSFVTEDVKTLRVKLSDKAANLLNELLESTSHKDLTTRQQICRWALFLIDESPKYIKTIKNFKL